MGFTTKRTLWYDLSARERSNALGLCAEVYVPAGSGWFDGHFPGKPVLPGVAQLSMVFELIGEAFGEELCVREVSRVRFKQMILPEDRLDVSAAPKSGQQGVYAFRITKNGKLACNGNMIVAATSASE